VVSRCDETSHAFIKCLGIEPPHIANAIFIRRAKGRPGRPTDEPQGHRVRRQLKCWFLKQMIEPARHADRAAVRSQTPRHPHTLLQRHRTGIPCPAGMSRPCRRLRRAAFVSPPHFLYGLLQRRENTPFPEQGCASPTGCSGHRAHSSDSNSRRVTPSICSDLISDMDSG